MSDRTRAILWVLAILLAAVVLVWGILAARQRAATPGAATNTAEVATSTEETEQPQPEVVTPTQSAGGMGEVPDGKGG